MAINLMCMNSDCKFYWEDCCIKSMNEERMIINSKGVCRTFEYGRSEWYKAEEDSITKYTLHKPNQEELEDLFRKEFK